MDDCLRVGVTRQAGHQAYETLCISGKGAPGTGMRVCQPSALEGGTRSRLHLCSANPAVLMDRGLHGPLELRGSRLLHPPFPGPPCSSQGQFSSVAGLILCPAISCPLCMPLLWAVWECRLQGQEMPLILTARWSLEAQASSPQHSVAPAQRP